MNKKEIINNSKCIGYMTITNTIGLELYRIEYGINNHIYVKFGTDNKVSYHKCMIYTNSKGEDYFYINKLKIMFADIMRI